MKKIVALVFLITFVNKLQAQSTEAYFLSNPSLSPNAETVVFSYEGDLWKANIISGDATRLTGMAGYETNAKFSPDGKWIAFTGRQYGNADVYVMPVNGGDVKQLTYHSANDEVSSWSWDSKTIYFQSTRTGQLGSYTVALEGGNASRIFGNYFFQFDHNVVAHPKTGELFFNDTWESSNQVQRKRYKGPFNPEIQSYNPTSKKYTKYTNWEGKDFGATLDRSGNLYFISDEANGEYNLYAIANNTKRALTKFPTSIKSPNVNADGGKIVFEKDYQLWMYDVASNRSEKLKINISRNSVLQKEKDFDVKGKISSFDVSGDGKKIAFISRGEIFVSDVEGKFINQIGKSNGERASEVKWMADNRTLLYNQTVSGFLNWFTANADGTGNTKRITNDLKDNRSVTFNKKKTMAVYLSGRNEVRMLVLKTMQDQLIATDEIWGFNNAAPSFSPDDQYIAYSAFRGFEEEIMLYNLAGKKVQNLTNTGVSESGPQWSADGKYIYFTSSRLKPSYPFGSSNSRVYQVPLENDDVPYKSDKFNELFKEEKKDTSKKNFINADSAVIKLNTKRFMERLEQVSPSFGTQQLISVFKKGDKTMLFYRSDHGDGKSALWKTTLEPFEENKTEKIAGTDGNDDFEIVAVADKMYLLSKGTIHKLNAETNKADAITISQTFRRNLQQEFSQIFEETWSRIEINYYDEKFHGTDWQKIRERYQPFIAKLNTRADLRILLNDMLGELNSSHQGFNTSGDDETVGLANRTMETGIIFENDNPYKVKYVVDRSAADKKNVQVLPGDVLQKVNDEQVNESIDRNYYFTKPSLDKEIMLTFKRAEKIFNVKLHPQASIGANLYDEWIDVNQDRVDKASNNKIAYAYMKNMGVPELEKFIIDMTQELNSKDALILDLRYNTGGNVHDEVLKFLQQRSYLQWKYREGALVKQGNFTPSDKPIVLLINEQSLSDAEMTAAGFKALKLGKVIGNETYRWIIFTSSASLVDGSSVRMPSWGCYTLDGKDLEFTGVQPDITVLNSFEDKMNGRDPQLDKAIAEVMQMIKK